MTVRVQDNSGHHLFGPVASRRLGRSLGVDLIPYKTCCLDCRYCECGPTTDLTIERRRFFPEEDILNELNEQLPKLNSELDFVTYAGSGEPTLSLSMRTVTQEIKKLTSHPLALLTNGILLYREDVIRDIQGIDVIIPSLDAADAKTFTVLNQPHADIDFKKYIAGLVNLREVFSGLIWLEILLCKGINDSPEHLANLRRHIERIQPDAIQLNTVFRPGADPDIQALSADALKNAEKMLGVTAQQYASVTGKSSHAAPEETDTLILKTIRRRPCTIHDLASGLNRTESEIRESLQRLIHKGELPDAEISESKFFFIHPGMD